MSLRFEEVVCVVVVMLEELPVELHLSLVTLPSLEQFGYFEILIVADGLPDLPRVVVVCGLVGVHVDYVQEGGHVERKLVRILDGRHVDLHDCLGVLLDLAPHGELVEQKILVE